MAFNGYWVVVTDVLTWFWWIVGGKPKTRVLIRSVTGLGQQTDFSYGSGRSVKYWWSKHVLCSRVLWGATSSERRGRLRTLLFTSSLTWDANSWGSYSRQSSGQHLDIPAASQASFSHRAWITPHLQPRLKSPLPPRSSLILENVNVLQHGALRAICRSERRRGGTKWRSERSTWGEMLI